MILFSGLSADSGQPGPANGGGRVLVSRAVIFFAQFVIHFTYEDGGIR